MNPGLPAGSRRGHHVLAARVLADVDLELRPAWAAQVQMVSDDQRVDLQPARLLLPSVLAFRDHSPERVEPLADHSQVQTICAGN